MTQSPEPRVLISRERIAERVRELGAQIERDHPDGSLVILGVLKGSFVFLADLARAIPRELRVEFLGVQSYGSAKTSSGAVQITLDLTNPIDGADVTSICRLGIVWSELMIWAETTIGSTPPQGAAP